MQDDTATWATLAMEKFSNKRIPFANLWQNFCKQFKACFKTIDEVVNTKENFESYSKTHWWSSSMLHGLKSWYHAPVILPLTFAIIFTKHLSTHIKDKLVHKKCLTMTFDDLVSVASSIDVHIHQWKDERDREKRHAGMATDTALTFTPVFSTPFISPAVEPTAMDVNVTYTHDEYMHQMKGKCFSCGFAVHTKKEGCHECGICTHCKWVGHWEVVCFQKFTGRPKVQTVAVVTTEFIESLGVNSSGGLLEDLDKEEIVATTSTTSTALATAAAIA